MMLIPHEILVKWNSVIDFKQSTLGVNSVKLFLRRSLSGRLVAKMQFISEEKTTHFDRPGGNVVEERWDLADQVDSKEGPMSLSQLEKLHLQLGHCNQRGERIADWERGSTVETDSRYDYQMRMCII